MIFGSGTDESDVVVVVVVRETLFTKAQGSVFLNRIWMKFGRILK